MTTTYSVVFRCDDGRAPRCRIRLEYSAAEIRLLDRGRVRAEQAGWALGFRTAPGVGVPPLPTFDLCPACAALRPAGPR